MYEYTNEDKLWDMYRTRDLQTIEACRKPSSWHLKGSCKTCGVEAIKPTTTRTYNRTYHIEDKVELRAALKSLIRRGCNVLTAREYPMPVITTAHDRGKSGQIYRGHFYDVETKSVLVIDYPGIPKPRLRGYLVFRQYLRERGFYLRVYTQDGTHLDQVNLTKEAKAKPKAADDPNYVPPWEDTSFRKSAAMFTGLTGSTKPMPKPKVKRIVGKNKADIRYKLV